MAEFNPIQTDLITATDRLLRKIDALYDYFSRDNKYARHIPFHQQKLSAAKTVIENIINKKLKFETHESSRSEDDLDELRTLLADSEEYLEDIKHEIEKITGKKIRFRSELGQSAH